MVIFAIAALSVFGMYGFAEKTLAFFNNNINAADQPLIDDPDQPDIQGRSYTLYYDEKIYSDSMAGYRHIYKQYYIVGQENAVGLVDAAGTVLLPQQYQDIIILPYTYILKQDEFWGFYSRETLELLSDNIWNQAEIELSEQGKIISDLVKVNKDGVYGATNHNGEIIISPAWDGLELYTYEAEWPLIRVQQDTQYGFINNSGDVIISVRYAYAQLNTYSVINTDEQGNENTVTVPIIYVCEDGQWGGIFRDSDGDPTSVDWNIEPTTEVLADYNASRV